jgi:hypothetical protein
LMYRVYSYPQEHLSTEKLGYYIGLLLKFSHERRV